VKATHNSRAAQKPDMKPSLRIVLLGYVIRGPLGGMAWHHLNYLLGLAELGHEVLFVEDSDDYPSCYDPHDHSVTTNPRAGLRFAADAFRLIGHDDAWCYFDEHEKQWHGPAAARVMNFCEDADVVLNVSGVNPLRQWTSSIPIRVLIDTDPLFTQLRHLQEPERLAFARQHNVFFTFGENIPAGTSKVPDDGLPWRATRQPISLAAWPQRPAAANSCYSTVMQWDSYSSRRLAGVEYGMKSRSFEPYFSLPVKVDVGMALALGGETAPRQQLAEAGWRVDDPMPISLTPGTYRDYIASSRGEWSVAKHGYVVARTGWFSERSCCYLACGRPVIVQDTGWPGCATEVDGLRFFSDPDGACQALQQIEADYLRHCRGARALAESLFSPEAVLRPLLQQAVEVGRQMEAAA
jgi:hypothetical protein